jgi:hypothetical protein
MSSICLNLNRRHTFARGIAILSAAVLAASIPASAQDRDDVGIHFFPGNLVVSRSVYNNNANNVKVGARSRNEQRCLSFRLQQRHPRPLFRNYLEDLPRPDHSLRLSPQQPRGA